MKRFISATALQQSSCSVSASPVHSEKLIWFTTWPARGRRRTFVAHFSVVKRREKISLWQSRVVSLTLRSYHGQEIGPGLTFVPSCDPVEQLPLYIQEQP